MFKDKFFGFVMEMKKLKNIPNAIQILWAAYDGTKMGTLLTNHNSDAICIFCH